MQQIGIFQLFEIVVNGFIVNGTTLGFQVIRNRLGRKRVADILKRVFDDALQLVDFLDLIPTDNIRENSGIINVPDDRINFVLRICLQVCGGKTAQTNIVGKLSFRIAECGVLLFECQIFAERQRIDAESNISSREVG